MTTENKKDWTGNKKSTFATLGASSHSGHDRAEHDYYATEPKAGEELLKLEPDLNNIWECACGEGHLAEIFYKAGRLGSATDLIYRNYGYGNYNFLKQEKWEWNGDIVTNPPYKYAKEFVQKALDSVQIGRKVCMFLKLTFLEGQNRKGFFLDTPPRRYMFQALASSVLLMENLKILGAVRQLMLGSFGKKATRVIQL